MKSATLNGVPLVRWQFATVLAMIDQFYEAQASLPPRPAALAA
jgi:hypothetical protein